MTDQQLAQNLRDAERDGDMDNIMYYENEIAARLNLPLDETEQGLTPEANNAIVDFCNKTGGFVMTEVLDSNGNTIRVGARTAENDGTVAQITDPDGDVNDYGQAIGINPTVLVEYDDGSEDRYLARWNATGPWDDHRDDYTCDDIAVAVDLRCRYSDCRERHAVAAEDEKVTCPTCREWMGLDEHGQGVNLSAVERLERFAHPEPDGQRVEGGRIVPTDR